MYEIIVLVLIWVSLPLFLIPYSLVMKSKNRKLRNQLEAYEKEFGSYYIPVNSNVSEKVQDHMPEQIQGNLTADISDNSFSCTKDDPVYECSSGHQQEPHSINISVLLITGVILVILAGLIFATTSWSDMSNQVRTLTVISGSVFFFAVSAFSEKKLKLNTTSKAFYILGCFFLPVSVIAISFFKMFGKWFSFEGSGSSIVFTAIFFVSSLAAAAGVYKYRFTTAAIISMASFSSALISLVTFSDNSVAATVILAAYSFILLSVKFKEPDKIKWIIPYTDHFRMFSRINAICLAVFSFIYAFFDPSVHNRSGFAAFALLFGIAVTLLPVFRSENGSEKNVAKLIMAVEYIAFSVFCVEQIQETAGITQNLLFKIISVMLIPAFIIFRFVPAMKSKSSGILMILTEFILVTLSDSTYQLPEFILFAFLIASAVSEKANVFKEIYSAVLPASLYILISSLYTDDLKCDYIYILLICAAAAVTTLFSGKSDILKKISCWSGVYVIVITPLIVLIAESEKYTDLLVISAAALTVGAVYSVLRREKKYITVSVLAASVHIQFWGFLKLIDSGYFDTDSTGVYITSVIIMDVMMSAGLLILPRYKLIGSQIIRTSALFVSLALLYDFPPYTSNWRFVFALCYAAFITANGYMIRDERKKKIIYTVAAGFVSAALMVQHFIDIPQILEAEYYTGASLFIHVFLRRIWKDKHSQYRSVLFVHSGICVVILMMCAMASNKTEDAIILASVCSVIMICSYILKSRRWFYLGGVSFAVVVLYITRDFWMSIAWWVYLLTAGIVFISFAGINEYCKTTGKENVIAKKIKSVIGKDK